MFNIVLVEPEIPANTGNIARTCAVTNCKLHLIRPLGFSIDEKHLKRAGLDYWQMLDINIYDNLEEFFKLNFDIQFYLATTKGSQVYSDINYNPGAYFLFGKETRGLPKELLEANRDKCLRIPMLNNHAARSLNLSNSVAVLIYEAFRQNHFRGLI
ncbi:MAG: tRNA (uridine(34)/cytosine(34)/5-carboxymethylaminomethyluridine(34)-2'-O)-methyltransferase TrmL [Bacillota bacterium]